MQPQTEPGLGVLLGKSDGAQENCQNCQPHIVSGSAWQGAGSGNQPPCALSRSIQFAEQGAEVLGDRGDEAAGGGTIRKARVLPEVAKHLEKMGLAAAEEATDPCAALARFAEVVQERANDFLDAVGVLTFADEGDQLTT